MLKETIWKAGVKGMKLIQREPDSIIFWDQTETENASLLYVFFFNLQEILYLFNVITKFKETIWSPVLRAWHQFRKNQIQKFFFSPKCHKKCLFNIFFKFSGNTVCVQCNDKAQRDHLGGRCQGHDIDSKRTRFNNILTTKCHKKCPF